MLPFSRPSRRTTALRCASVALLAATVASCSSGDDEGTDDGGAPDPTAEASGAAARAVLAAPGEPATVVPAASAGERALAGAALFESAPAVVLAPDGDLAAQAPAASAAVALGVPLLLTPTDDSSDSSPDDTSTDDTADDDAADDDAASDGTADDGTADDEGTGDTASDGTAGDDSPAGEGAGGTGDASVEEALARLEPATLLAFGDAAGWAEGAAGDDGPEVVTASIDADGAPVDGVEVGEAEDVAEDGLFAAVAALSPDAPPALRLSEDAAEDGAPADEGATGTTAEDEGGEGATDASGDGSSEATGAGAGAAAGESAGADDNDGESADGGQGDAVGEGLGRVQPAEEGLGGALVLAGGGGEDVALAATARAAGARVVAVPDGDPRADPEAIAAIAGAEGDAPPEQVVAVGDAFAGTDAEVLRARVDVAATGVELPGGGQVLYPGRRMAALYGHPGTPAMGVLGEQGVAESIARAEALAAEYDTLVDEPVVPAFEVIATVASSAAGPDGDYSAESEVADLRPWVDAAAEAGVYVVLDLQPGRTDFLTQAQRYEELLREPHVGLALDPEWRIGPDQRHLEQIGSVGIDEVNQVGDWLAQLTADNDLPQKLLLLHQFRTAMIDGRERLDMGHDELAVLVHADGFGSAGQKFATWDALHQGAPEGVWWGWKNFYDEDQPMFTPAQTTAIRPAPVFVSYQ